ncbi:unnamed protein product [Amaranthus hypochondriacus]
MDLRSRICDISNFLSNSRANSADEHTLLQDCFQAIQTDFNQIVAHHSDVASFNDQDLDAYMDRLRDEMRKAEADTASLSDEIDSLRKLYVEGSCQLEANLESLCNVVEKAELEGLSQAETGTHVEVFKSRQEVKPYHDDYFEVLKLKYHIEKNYRTLKSFQNLDLNLKRIEALENIEEALTGLKVIDFEGNIIRVSLRTYIPAFEGVMCQLSVEDDNIKLSEVNHELLLELIDGTMELKNVEIFPNDVSITKIVEAAKIFSKLFSVLLLPQTRTSLGWFLQKVQDRIVMCTVRHIMVKIASKSRYSFEYFDKDESIIGHIGGLEAIIKPSENWPLSLSALKLVSFRSCDENANEISSCLLSKVEEANSFDLNTRKSITNFVGGIIEILPERIREELHI